MKSREFFNILRQSFLILLMLLSFENKKAFQLTTITLLNLQLNIYLNHKPRVKKTLNRLEIFSSIACFFTSCFFSFLNFRLQTILQQLFLITILLIHGSFLVLFVFEISKRFLIHFSKRIMFLKNYFTSRSNTKSNMNKKALHFDWKMKFT
jgi:hypothetical protein